MDTKTIYKIQDEDTFYGVSEDGPDTVLFKMREDLLKDAEENIQILTKEISQEEFNEYFKDAEILDGDLETLMAQCL